MSLSLPGVKQPVRTIYSSSSACISLLPSVKVKIREESHNKLVYIGFFLVLIVKYGFFK